MNSELYQPTLAQEGVKKTESFALEKIFYVAFFGGTVAVTGLAAMNARMLRKGGTAVAFIIGIGLLIMAGKGILYYNLLHDLIGMEQRTARYIGRAADLAFFTGCYFYMKRSYKNHLMLHGETRPLLKAAIGWILLSIAVEAILIGTLAGM